MTVYGLLRLGSPGQAEMWLGAVISGCVKKTLGIEQRREEKREKRKEGNEVLKHDPDLNGPR